MFAIHLRNNVSRRFPKRKTSTQEMSSFYGSFCQIVLKTLGRKTKLVLNIHEYVPFLLPTALYALLFLLYVSNSPISHS